MAHNLDSDLDADSSFRVRVKLSLSDEDIKARLESDDFIMDYRTFMWGTFDGSLYIHAGGSEILTPKGFDSHPLFHAEQMLARSQHYITIDDSRYSAEENPVLLLGREDESKEFNDWLRRHTITARCTSVYPRLTIVRREDSMEINYLSPDKAPQKSIVAVEDFAGGMISLAEKAEAWASAVSLPPEHPPFEEFYRSIETAKRLKQS